MSTHKYLYSCLGLKSLQCQIDIVNHNKQKNNNKLSVKVVVVDQNPIYETSAADFMNVSIIVASSAKLFFFPQHTSIISITHL